MTERLYDTDAYGVVFDATVVSAEKDGDNTMVVLDRTFFFPEEGGQEADRGTIEGLKVLDVKHKGEDIFHLVEGTLECGEKVHGIVDWEFRFRNMQMHSGEHIFSGLVFRNYGFHNVGFHLSENSATMDFDGKLTAEDIRSIEMQVNRIIAENHPIRAWYPNEEELALIPYRSKKALEGPVRLVEVEGTDICACCATHVHATAEIGCFLVTSFENYKGGVRLYYLAGLRALEYINECRDSLIEISRLLSTKTDNVKENVTKLLDETKQLRFRLMNAERENIAGKIRDYYLRDGGDADNLQTIECGKALFLQADNSILRHTMDEMERYYSGICAVFNGDDENGYRYLVESKTCNVSDLQIELRTQLQAKGGGAPNSVSGSIASKKEDILRILEKYNCK